MAINNNILFLLLRCLKEYASNPPNRTNLDRKNDIIALSGPANVKKDKDCLGKTLKSKFHA